MSVFYYFCQETKFFLDAHGCYISCAVGLMSCCSFLPPVLHLKIPQINSLDALLIPSSATCQAPKINSFHPPSSLSATPRAPLIALMPCHPFPPPFLRHKSVPLMSCHPVPPPFLHHKSIALMSCHPVPPPFLHHKSVALMSCHPVPPPFLHHKS